MLFTDLFNPGEYEDVLRLLAREYIENHCSCGNQSTTTDDHAENCRYRQQVDRYRKHADLVVATRLLVEQECKCKKSSSSDPALHANDCQWVSSSRHYQRYPLEMEKDLTAIAAKRAGLKTPATPKGPPPK